MAACIEPIIVIINVIGLTVTLSCPSLTSRLKIATRSFSHSARNIANEIYPIFCALRYTHEVRSGLRWKNIRRSSGL